MQTKQLFGFVKIDYEKSIRAWFSTMQGGGIMKDRKWYKMLRWTLYVWLTNESDLCIAKDIFLTDWVLQKNEMKLQGAAKKDML